MSKKTYKNISGNKLNSTLIIAAVILLVINVGLYWKSVNYNFVWDDHRTHIHSNQNMMEDNVIDFWKKSYVGLYIPVSYTTWSWIKDISLKEVKGNKIPDAKTFHTVNIILHSINSIILLYLLYLLTGATWFSFAGALLFSIHPLQVESVVWISEYRGLLSAFFSLGSLILYFIYRKNEKEDNKLVIFSSVLFILALLSKPSAIVLPLFVIAFEYFILKGERKKYLIPLIWFLLTIPVMLITKLSQPGTETEFAAPLWTRPFIAGDAISFYLFKFFLPFDLSASYGRTPEAVINVWYIYILWIIPLVLLFFIWKLRNTEPIVALGIFIFLIGVLPISGLLSFEFQKFSTVADRYIYLSMIGAAIVLVRILQKYKTQQWIFYASGAVAIIFLFINSNQQEIWKDDLTLWKSTSEKNPGQAHVHNNFGIALHDAGKFDEAIMQYNLAIETRPSFATAYNNRGNSYAFKRDFQKALHDHTKAIELDPSYGRAWFNRAVTYFQLSNLQAAYNDLQQAERNGYKPHPQFRKDLENEIRKRN
ncbi:MAG: tetratricopeptide repeat protein [Bacteroidia bacterium]